MSSLIKTESVAAKKISFIISEDESSQRLDRYLAQNIREISRSAIQKLIAKGAVCLNGEVVRARAHVKAGDQIECILPAPNPTKLTAEAISLDILYEDEGLLIINKPPGLVVHPAAGHPSKTLVNALLHYDPGIASVGSPGRPGIVHRLDKGTSGVMLVARTEAARLSLAKQFKEHSVYKEYWALVHGVLSPMTGTFTTRLGRHPRHRKKFASGPSGRLAETDYKVQESFGGLFSTVQVVLHTGRTHQIRVHLSEAGHPIVGDKTYGGRRDTRKVLPQALREAIKTLDRPALHAAILGFTHPVTGKKMRFKAALPEELRKLIELLKCV